MGGIRNFPRALREGFAWEGLVLSDHVFQGEGNDIQGVKKEKGCLGRDFKYLFSHHILSAKIFLNEDDICNDNFKYLFELL